MELDYNSFINGLLNNPSTTTDDRERIVTLLLKERDKGYVTEEQVLDLIKKYTSADDSKGTRSEEKSGPEPKQTYEFLSFFCRNDGGMKNLTHDFNYGYIDYDSFMNQCKKEFMEGKEKFPKVPKALITRIEEFAFSKSPKWYIRLGNEKKYIEYGWSEPSFIEWYKKNKLHPVRDTFYNEKMIMPFKESIQIRSDTGNLRKLLDSNINKVFGDVPCCEIRISDNVASAQFYTDVDNLSQAFYQILSTIKDASEKNFCNEVDIDYCFEGDLKVITITHIDSKPSKRSDDKDYEGGNTDAIGKTLSGLCNYEIIAQFPDGAYRKLIRSDNKKEYLENKYHRIKVNSEDVKGYTHVLKFY